MGKGLQFLLIVGAGAVIGFLVGPWLTDSRRTAPPLDEEMASTAQLTALYLAKPVTPGTSLATGEPAGGQATRKRRDPDEEDSPAVDQEVFVPSLAGPDDLRDDDMSLIPRGPGRFAVLDLAATGRRRLAILRGHMTRDGDGDVQRFIREPKVGVLRGRKVRVELLHLGFDENGVAVIAHIRTTDVPAIEGIVLLQHGEQSIAIAPWRPPVEDQQQDGFEVDNP